MYTMVNAGFFCISRKSPSQAGGKSENLAINLSCGGVWHPKKPLTTPVYIISKGGYEKYNSMMLK